MSYKVKTIGPVEVFKTSYGEMKKYSLQFEGSDEWVKLNQKIDSPAPAVGQELDGNIEDTQYGKQFKKAQTAAGGQRGGYMPDPATRSSIERQSALKAAVEAVHNYSTTLGSEQYLTLEQYVGRVVNVAKVFANSIETGQGVKIEPPKQEIEPQTEAQAAADTVDLSDIPF